MHTDFGAMTWYFPMSVLIIGTYDEKGNPNAMNAAWTGTWDKNHIMISLAHHATTENIDRNMEFTVAFGTTKEVVACDYVGLVSAQREPNKIEKAGWTAVKAEHVNAPVFEQLPLTLECKVVKKLDVSETGYYLIGEIVNVRADNSILGEDGNPDLTKLQPIIYDPIHNHYYNIGEKVGIAFHDGLQLKNKNV